MTDDPRPDPDSDPDKLKGPGGMTLRQIHEQVQKSVVRDREAHAAHKSPRTTAKPLATLGALCMGP